MTEGGCRRRRGIAHENCFFTPEQRLRIGTVKWRRWRREPRVEPNAGEGGLVALAALALVGGAGSGLIVALFRLALTRADDWRGALITGAHHHPVIGPVSVVLGCAAAVSVAAWLVRRFSPYASGSGIPQVEGALTGDLPPARPRLIPVKFFGALLAIGAGMALGREGPSVQIGAVAANLISNAHARRGRRRRRARRCLQRSHRGAVFVLEELVGRLETRVAISALGASAAAILISRLFLGDTPISRPW